MLAHGHTRHSPRSPRYPKYLPLKYVPTSRRPLAAGGDRFSKLSKLKVDIHLLLLFLIVFLPTVRCGEGSALPIFSGEGADFLDWDICFGGYVAFKLTKAVSMICERSPTEKPTVPDPLPTSDETTGEPINAEAAEAAQRKRKKALRTTSPRGMDYVEHPVVRPDPPMPTS
eukprot:scaffold10109_cov32-Tisochrysis_lutea.AAC.1